MGTSVVSPRVRETRHRARRDADDARRARDARRRGGDARHHLGRASDCDVENTREREVASSVDTWRPGKDSLRLRAAAIVARAWRFHARGGDAEGRFSDRLAAGGARVSPGAGAQIAALPHALGSSSHIQRLLGFRGGPVGRARERDAAGHARLRRAQRKRAAGYVDDQASAPELEAGHGSAPCR